MAYVNREDRIVQHDSDLLGIGHRMVHGGEFFRKPTVINDKVVAAIRKLIPLAPLHNPSNLLGIEAARARFPGVPQVAVFDTAFHHTLPPKAFHYATPHDWYANHHVRRYGFHGTSHRYVSREACRHLSKELEEVNLITLHLGNGASVTAVQGGLSVDTSMGLTPLEGLVMGTRSGGIGENAPLIRERACEGLEPLGIAVDAGKNETVSGNVAEVQKDGAAVKVLVVRTDEELEIARQTINAIKKARGL